MHVPIANTEQEQEQNIYHSINSNSSIKCFQVAYEYKIAFHTHDTKRVIFTANQWKVVS